MSRVGPARNCHLDAPARLRRRKFPEAPSAVTLRGGSSPRHHKPDIFSEKVFFLLRFFPKFAPEAGAPRVEGGGRNFAIHSCFLVECEWVSTQKNQLPMFPENSKSNLVLVSKTEEHYALRIQKCSL